jgi:hypothetical protein
MKQQLFIKAMQLSILPKKNPNNKSKKVTMKKALLLVVLNFLSLHLLGQNKFTPQQFLGYNIGEQFTRHHRVVEYFYALEKAFPENLKVV